MGGAHGTRGRNQKCLKILVGNPERKSFLRRLSCRQDDNKMDREKYVWRCGLDLSDSGLEPVAGFYERGSEFFVP